MSTKQPVLLTVLIECQSFRWYVAGIDLEGKATPLLCSQAGNLRGYIGESFDSQANFLRHRLAGVLQRGCDRLWGKNQKPCQIVFVADGPFQEASPELTQRVADHFDQWMTNPPVVFFVLTPNADGPSPNLSPIAGQIPSESLAAVIKGLPYMIAQCDESDPWELIVTKPSP